MKKLKLYLDNCCFNRPYDITKNEIKIINPINFIEFLEE